MHQRGKKWRYSIHYCVRMVDFSAFSVYFFRVLAARINILPGAHHCTGMGAVTDLVLILFSRLFFL